jgi:hypothetical protein
VEQVIGTYGRIGEIMIVRNNQDGSHAFPADLSGRPESQIKLDHLSGGLQAVRLCAACH